MSILGTAIDEITLFLMQESKLEHHEIRLSKLLSVNVTLKEALDLELTNYFSFISSLMRTNGINVRSLLNEMTDFNNRIESQLHKMIEEQVEAYHKLELD
jgi:hypothetical protein